ncbi:MAG TPA: hypothetical protein VGN64_09690 [Dyadobacter sp.]|jgi:hypothetical protein|nr:hypothetical protein [Dyadobacter sp.]
MLVREIQPPPGTSFSVQDNEHHGSTPDGAQDLIELVSPAKGKPAISLSLVLQRQPGTQESISALIESGVLAFEIKLKTTIFARHVRYQLLWESGSDFLKLAQGESSGKEARVSLSANLDKDQCLDALAALQSQHSRFRIVAYIDYRQDGNLKTINLSGFWSQIHSFLKLHSEQEGRISKSNLSALIPFMLEDQLLKVSDENGNAVDIQNEILNRLFMRQSGVVLKELVTFDGGEPYYVLRSAPPSGYELSYSEQLKVTSIQTKNLEVTLQHLASQSINLLDDHLFLVAHKPEDPSQVVPVPIKIPASRSNREVNTKAGEKPVAVIGNTLTSVSLAMRPSVNAAIYVKPQTGILLHGQFLEGMSVDLNKSAKPKSLPVGGDPHAAYWPDRLNAQKVWYAQEFELVVPSMNTGPESSPFLFSYETAGVTSSGKPALKGKLRFTLQRKTPKKTLDAIRANGVTNAEAVPTNSLSIVLQVPFVNETDGIIKQHSVTATFSVDRDKITAEVELLNDWVRLVYGALSTEGFQSMPIQIQVTFTFNCYVAVGEKDFNIVFGAKSFETPVLYTAAETVRPVHNSYLNVSTLAFVHPISIVRFQRESPVDRSRDNVMLAKPLQLSAFPAIRPQATLVPQAVAAVKRVKYALRTQVRQSSLPLLYPCNKFGMLFQEIKDGTRLAIGCQDALKLGETKYRQYEEIIELRDNSYFQIFRSLSQPGIFVIVPTRFCVTRREAGERDEYRPMIFLNALLDGENAGNNKVELRTSLQPDIPLFRRIEILEKLKAFHPSPTISYSTEIPSEDTLLNWALDPGITANCESDMSNASGPFVSAFFSMDIPSWQLLKSVLQSPGLGGSIIVRLADGSEFVSNLLVKLDQVHGPWLSGPLELAETGGQVQITNKTESVIEVSDLVRYSGSSITEQVPLEISLASEQSHTVSASPGLVAIYSYPLSDPVAIEETRSFVEDIYSNFIFINLIAFGNHSLSRLDVEARVRGLDRIHHGVLTETEPVIDFDYMLPLTTYLSNHILDFRIKKTFSIAGRADEWTNWIEWDLNRGPVSITSEFLSL